MKDDRRLLAGKRLLVIEDGCLLDENSEKALREASALIGRASSIERALEFLNVSTVDAVVWDVDCDGKNWFPLIERLEAVSIPFIFATSRSKADVPIDYSGYILSENAAELGAIAKALFGPWAVEPTVFGSDPLD